MRNIAKLQKIASQNKKDTYLLQVSLLGLYSEWEGGIKRKIDELLEKVNERNQTKFRLEKEIFFGNRNLNHEEFKKIWKKIFDKSYEGESIKSSFFEQRNRYAHGDFESMKLQYRDLQNYFTQIKNIFSCFEAQIDSFIEMEEYIKR